jgi:hypothetical protein
MSRYCKIVVLPEDVAHADLARGFFQGRSVSERAYELQRRWTGRNGNNAAVRRWLCEEVRLQVNSVSPRYGILALIDEDGQGLDARRNEVREALGQLRLPTIDPNQGRCLVLPMRNVETWMVWAARWQDAGGPTSPVGPPSYQSVSEEDDYKRFKRANGDTLPRESMTTAYIVGKTIAALNPTSPPAGIPPALREVLQPLNEFLRWARL